MANAGNDNRLKRDDSDVKFNRNAGELQNPINPKFGHQLNQDAGGNQAGFKKQVDNANIGFNQNQGAAKFGVQPDKFNPGLQPGMKPNVQPLRSGVSVNQMKAVKISEHPDCASDVQRLCKSDGGSKSTNNFVILDCLQDPDNKENDVSVNCQHFVWNYKKNLTLDIRFDSAAVEQCKDTLGRFPECNALPRGQGKVIPCLIDNMRNVTETMCKAFITKMATIVFSDYRLIDKFADACAHDIDVQHCGRLQGEVEIHSQGKTVECLSTHVKDLDSTCKHEILRIAELQAEDYHLDRPLYYACRDDRERFCKRVKAGSKKVEKCLLKHKFERDMSAECRSKLVIRQRLMVEDVKVNKGLYDACKREIRRNECVDKDLSGTREIRMSHILLCLEGAIRDDRRIEPECLAEIKDTRRMMMEDFEIDPGIVANCASEIKDHCGGGVEREGKTLHCLMRHIKARDEGITPKCKRALETLLRVADVGENVLMDPQLEHACRSVMDVSCKNHKAGDSEMMNCLMEKVDTDAMTDECEERLMEIQYFIARDFKLSDSHLYKNCKKDAVDNCHATDKWFNDVNNNPEQAHLVFSCLYTTLRDDATKLSRACAFEVRRVMRQRAVSVKLEPRIEEPCLRDLGFYCSDRTKLGEEMDCLKKNYDELEDDCKKVVGEFVEDEDKDPNLDKILMKSCTPMIKEFCSPMLEDKETAPEDIMDCLIKHKHFPDMDSKCAAGIEHHQLINLKDYRFSYKFKEACKQDVLTNCKNGIRQKADVIKCLSEVVRNDTLLELKHRVSRDCRKQLRAEMLQRSESINMDPKLKDACEFDIQEKCKDVDAGHGKIIECLKQHQKELSSTCKDILFKREKDDAVDSRTDFSLVTTCKDMIKTYCSDVQPGQLFSCLRKHKEEEDFNQKCKRIIIERMRIRSEDVRLNPILQKACKMDISKFCQKEMQSVQQTGLLEGKVINCLRIKFAQKRLSQTCEDHIGEKIRESANDFRQDHRLATSCGAELKEHCTQAMAQNEQDSDHGQVEECLKAALANGKIKNAVCITEIVRVLSENKADVHVDPLLYRACALDIKHYCDGVPRGEGRQMSCLLAALDDKSVRLKPECHKMMTDRVQMWEYAAKVQPPDTVFELLNQVTTSSSKNYFLGIIFTVIGCIFIGGLFCGRVTKRVTVMAKNK